VKIGNCRLLFHGLMRSALNMPEKTAVIVEGASYSYQELDEASSRLSACLAARGVKRGDRVAVFMENSWPCVVSIFAASKAGAVLLVINPQTKQDKLHYILDNSDAKALLTDARLDRTFLPILSSLNNLSAIICSGSPSENTSAQQLNVFEDIIKGQTQGHATRSSIPIDLAALIYTSGSTGEPKGVMHTHHSITFAIESLIEYLRLNSEDRILNILPLAFDYGLYQLFMSVWLGATLVLERSFTYPAEILNRIDDEQVTVFPGVPTIFTMLISLHARQSLCLDSVRRVTNTAAALPVEHLPMLKEIFPSALIYKMYGLTECKRVSYLEPELLDQYPASVGRAIPGTEVFLIDSEGKQVGPGGEGILCVRGPHVMKGYWKKPDISAYMLIDGRLPGEKILCSHDIFYMDKNGLLYFKGRSDDIIKTRGEKVSPAEIENTLYGIEGIREAVVVGEPDAILGEAVVAYVVLDKTSDLTDRKIKQHCFGKLENFMVPQKIVIVDQLPKTMTGKISQKALANTVKGDSKHRTP